ncbi:MAG: hypothetical protein ABGZ23_21260, partial [Fuerstiella sp.]
PYSPTFRRGQRIAKGDRFRLGVDRNDQSGLNESSGPLRQLKWRASQDWQRHSLPPVGAE